MNIRTKTRIAITAALSVVFLLYLSGILLPKSLYAVDLAHKNSLPSPAHLFGTDWLGRDMFFRTLKGLHISITIGMFASCVSSVIALVLGTAAAVFGRKADYAVLFLVDLFQGVPHLIFLIFIALLAGRNFTGIMIAVAATHWPPLTRVIRAEIISLKNRQYILVARRLGVSRLMVAVRHLLPHIAPQFIINMILLFPHAILHEAGLTFLGMGIPPEQPAIGVILSESMRYITSGCWWLSVFPGISLLMIVLLFDQIGKNLQKMMQPETAQE